MYVTPASTVDDPTLLARGVSVGFGRFLVKILL
jgi:hypothetical protein